MGRYKVVEVAQLKSGNGVVMRGRYALYCEDEFIAVSDNTAEFERLIIPHPSRRSQISEYLKVTLLFSIIILAHSLEYFWWFS